MGEPLGELEPAPPHEDTLRRLDSRYVGLQRVTGGIVTAAVALNVLIAAIVIPIFDPLPGWAAALLIGGAVAFTLLLAWFCWVWPEKERRHTSYLLTARGIEIRRGVVWRRRILVPRSRIQHSDVAQGPIQRRFGLATLHLYTAGTEHSAVEVPGLSHEDAIAVRDRLSVASADDAV